MPETNLTTLGERIRYARELIGDSIEDMSDAFSVTSSTVERWESLNVIPTLSENTRDTLVTLIARYLGCSLEWLRDDVGMKPIAKVTSLDVARRHKRRKRRSTEFREMITFTEMLLEVRGELEVGPPNSDNDN